MSVQTLFLTVLLIAIASAFSIPHFKFNEGLFNAENKPPGQQLGFIQNISANNDVQIEDVWRNSPDISNLSNLYKEGNVLPLLAGNVYRFYSKDSDRSGPYIYNDIFSPLDSSQLYLNYFNAWYVPEFDEENHYREKRSDTNLYHGSPDLQFTYDDIDEFINLKTKERYKKHTLTLREAFKLIKNNLNGRIKVNKNKGNIRKKLSIIPENNKTAIDSITPSNLEHIGKHILEDIIRVCLPREEKTRHHHRRDNEIHPTTDNKYYINGLPKRGNTVTDLTLSRKYVKDHLFRNTTKTNKVRHKKKKNRFVS